MTLPIAYDCDYLSPTISGTSSSKFVVLDYNISLPFPSESPQLDCRITDFQNATFRYVHNTTQRFVGFDSGFRQSDVYVSSIVSNTYSGGANLGTEISFSLNSRFVDTSSVMLSFFSASDNSLLYTQTSSLSLNVTSSVPSIPSDANLDVSILGETMRVSSAVTSMFLPIDTNIPSVTLSESYVTSSRDPLTVLGINDTVYFHFNSSLPLNNAPSCVLGSGDLSKSLYVELDTSIHIIASYEISPDDAVVGDLVCDLRSMSNNTASNVTVFENFPSSILSLYTIYTSVPSVTSISVSGVDSDGISLTHSRPLYLGVNSVLVVSLTSSRDLTGKCTFLCSLVHSSTHTHTHIHRNMHTIKRRRTNR